MTAGSLKSILKKAVATVLVCLSALFVTEFNLWVLSPTDFYINAPDSQSIVYPSPEILPGLSGETVVSFNSDGLRGPEIPADDSLKMVALGASTTIQYFVDDQKIWPVQLKNELIEAGYADDIWLGVAGRSGVGVLENTLHLEYLIERLPDIDIVVMLVGGIDTTRALTRKDREYMTEKWLYRKAFEVHKRGKLLHPFHPNSISRKRWNNFYTRISKEAPPGLNDDVGESIASAREKRKNALEIIDTLPDLEESLATYAERLNNVVDIAIENDIELIFATQPSLYAPDLAPELRDLIWSGGFQSERPDGRAAYYSVRVMAETLGRFNQQLLDICATRNLQCIDLASRVPKDTSVFVDQVHFNDSGSRQVAEILAESMLANNAATRMAGTRTAAAKD